MIFEHHVRCSRFDLRIQYCEPQLLGLDRLSGFTLTFVLRVEFVKCFPVTIGQSRTFVGTKETPRSIVFDPLHEQIRHPQGIEQIPCTIGFIAMIFAQFQKLKNVGMPRFQINGNATLAFATSLIDISGSIVEDTQHGDNPIGGAIGTTNVRSTGTNVVHCQSNATRVFGNDGTIFESVVNAIDAVIFHRQ